MKKRAAPMTLSELQDAIAHAHQLAQDKYIAEVIAQSDRQLAQFLAALPESDRQLFESISTNVLTGENYDNIGQHQNQEI